MYFLHPLELPFQSRLLILYLPWSGVEAYVFEVMKGEEKRLKKYGREGIEKGKQNRERREKESTVYLAVNRPQDEII